MNNKIKGGRGESAAEKFLNKKGFKTLVRNFKAIGGEIDLIMQCKNVIVFVEVKSRNSLTYGSPCEAVTFQKQKHIISAATAYLQNTGKMGCPVRFDVVEVFESRIEHIENAFGLN